MYRFEIEVNSTHVLVFLTVVAVVYAAVSMYYLIRDGRRMDVEGRKERETASASDDDDSDDDIMGKSKFVLSRHIKPPLTAVTESATDHPRQIAPEELDKVFGTPPEGEPNEPLKIYHPLYVERPLPKVETDGGPRDSDDDETEYLSLRGRHPAHGVRFEELGDAYHRVVYNPVLTEKEEITTGRILLDLRPTDMFEYVVSGSRERENKAIGLMETYLEAFQKRMEAEEAKNLPPQDVIAPQGYSVFDNVKPVVRRPR